MAYPSSQLPRITFRLSEGLLGRLSVAAKTNGRSLNAEIVARLEGTFEFDDNAGGVAEWKQEIETKLDQIDKWYQEDRDRIEQRLAQLLDRLDKPTD